MSQTNLDWPNLSFGYLKTNKNARCYYRDGSWGELEITDSEYINMHMAAVCLHYGQQCFEGLKAYTGQDGKIRLFRWQENLARMNNTAKRLMMPEVPAGIFERAIKETIALNQEFIPPYKGGATLYIRPLLIGSGPEVGVKPAKEYLFLVFVTPVGPYFKEGFNPVSLLIDRDYDRAAPLGTGHVKAGGNYAASLEPLDIAHKEGFASTLFLDAREKKYIDESGPANFFGIKDNTYITPDSTSILPSITNDSLMTLAHDMGMQVEKRKIPVEELETFEEVGACGTAAVISPVKKVVDKQTNKVYEYGDGEKAGPISTKLYEKLKGIQYGDVEDKWGWVEVVEL